MADIVPVERDVIEELRTLREHSAYSAERERAGIVLAVLNGASRCAAARLLGHARSTVLRTMKLFEEGGADALRDGRRERPSAPRMAQIVEALPRWTAGQPTEYGWCRATWTVELLALQAGHELGVAVSRSQMGRLLKRAGCRRLRPRPTVVLAPPDKHERAAALEAELRALPPEDVVAYADEVDIHLNPKVGPDWCPPGIRKTLPTPGQNQKWYLAGAYDPATKELVWEGGERKNSDLFIGLVQRLAERFREAGRVHLVVDNYIIHHSKKTQKALADLGGKVVLHFLPPYSPEYNVIERVWWDLHAVVTRNHRCPNMAALRAEVEAFCTAFSGRGGHRAGLARRAA